MKNDGGPAFPQSETVSALPPNTGVLQSQVVYGGMSVRDYFAAKAIPVVSKWMPPLSALKKDGGLSELAKMAYEVADAMLEEKNKND